MNTIDFVKTDFEDLSCHTGVTFEVNLRMVEACTGIPDDLSGYSAVLKIMDEDENIITGLTGPSGATGIIGSITGSITDPEKGIINFTIPASVTNNFTLGMYYHQIETVIGSRVDRIGQGSFEVLT